ncbi:hypothetical protein AS156_14255 [Bradyrhizobium macuxiense]|uniref:Helix-turn-helix protein n=1 Tax=Bradyrhizobium macuxiense TaxID=1755647 RepID=A0A109JKI7_9BRAD|nr:helix-turn-helix domain-containing protein [Bradyrhizobium macuxiense]KWV50484.1 hypothetical protein AS156_14255 [Bradyrhizobium macuxiense]
MSHTSTAADFNKTRAAFMEHVSARDIPAQALKLAYLIAFKYMNRESRDARPSQDRLADDLAVTVRTVQRLLDILRPLGLIVIPGHGPNQASTYRLEEKATPMSPIEAENTTPMSPIEEGKGDIPCSNRRHLVREKATFGAGKGDTHVAPTNKKNQEEEPRKKNQGSISIRAQARESDHRNGAHVSDRSGRNLRKHHRANGRQHDADAFDEFYRAYPKHKAKGEAEKAYARIIGNGEATAGELLAGAQRYADERSGQEPKFTKHPATWLNKKCWLDEPAVRSQTQTERLMQQCGLLGGSEEDANE